ncbi:hypothetical protein JCM3765_004037 [Sporobolomyces pararoseus]
MSFSSLPPELVHQIIESTVPHTFHSTAYKDRQRTLCSLSLVSKLFRSIAQPLLFEIVRLKRVGDAKKLPTVRALGGNTHPRRTPRWLVMDWMDYGVVPNLGNFALVDNSEESAEWLKESSTSAFLLGLETLYIDGVVWLKLDNSFRQSVASRTFVDIVSVGLRKACNTIVHARLEGSSVDEEGFSHKELCDELDSYAIFIENTPSLSLRSFYLDSSLSGRSNLPQSLQSSITHFPRICQERKIDLVFERVPSDYSIDPWISTEFVRRQKEQRTQEAEGEGETGSSAK